VSVVFVPFFVARQKGAFTIFTSFKSTFYNQKKKLNLVLYSPKYVSNLLLSAWQWETQSIEGIVFD
jgi:hypothetical protein